MVDGVDKWIYTSSQFTGAGWNHRKSRSENRSVAISSDEGDHEIRCPRHQEEAGERNANFGNSDLVPDVFVGSTTQRIDVHFSRLSLIQTS